MSLWDEIKEGYTYELEKCWDKYRQNRELTGSMLETIDKLAHTIKSVATIEAMDDAGFSKDDNMNRGYSARSSYAGRKRDSMGRYSRTDNPVRPYGYSRGDARAELMEHLQGLMDNAENEQTRAMVHKWMEQAEREL